MAWYQDSYPEVQHEKEDKNTCLKESLKKALKILLNFKYLDLTINPNTAHFGLRFYTLFNRLDAVGGVMPKLKCDFVSLQADITVPAGYTPRFDNTNRSTIIPVCDLRAIALVVQPGRDDDLLRELKKHYEDKKVHDEECSCNKDILRVLLDCRCDVFDRKPVFEIGVDAIDRSFNPVVGKVVAHDSELAWIQAPVTDTPPTFYVVPMKYIPFICIED